MDDSELQRLVDAMDRLVPHEGARVELFPYGGGPEETRMVANQLGYLRLGTELIRFGLRAGTPGGPHVPPPNLADVWHPESEICIDWFSCAEPELRPPPAPSTQASGMRKYAVLAILGAVAVLGGAIALRLLSN